MNSMFENSGAFAPFFDTPIAVRGKRSGGELVALTLKASVVEGGYDDIVDGVVSRVKTLDVQFPVAKWPYPQAPQTGDTITLLGIKGSWAVKKVDLSMGGIYTLETREI
jgi:hypothetical protein